jgi:hypothetical protein
MGLVTAPQAAAPRVGLIAAARVLTGADAGPRWQAGFGYLPEACSAGGVARRDCATGSLAIDAGDTPDNVEFNPIVLWAGDACSVIDLPRDWQGRARRLLVACQSKLLAAELWNGDLAASAGLTANRYLASNDANTVTNGALAEVNALACLEDALAACSCGRSMIHCTPGTAIQWKAHNLIERVPAANGFLYVTPQDTIVVADAGYDGSSPDGNPAVSGSVWAYGTSLVDVRLGDIVVTPDNDTAAVNRSLNDFEYRAQRLAAATFDGCCHVAAEIDIDICADLTGS